ncbi:M56 family metallopeptidase [Candidatus Woesebacteria bacterium]|nr:MAG: M56 family metallopeptidase [Candidatus Woesebacteria bacterium]
MIKINKNLALFSGLFLLLGTLLFYTLQKFSPLLGHVTYYCQSLLIEANMVPIPYYLSIIPFAFLFIILTISIIKFLILYIKVQFLKYKLGGNVFANQKIDKLIMHLGLQDKVSLVKSSKHFAFCLGIRTTKIYISTGLLSQLSVKEVEAVLLHEQYHLENRDTFTMIVASVAHSLFPFFPLVGDLITKYRIDREIAADQYAVKRLGNHYALISALKKLLAFPTVQSVPVAAIADHDTLEPRIYSLVDKPFVKKQFKLKHLLITVFSSLILATIFVVPVHAKELHHEEHDVMMLCADGACMNSCASEKSLNKFYSEIPNTEVNQPNASQPYTPTH